MLSVTQHLGAYMSCWV